MYTNSTNSYPEIQNRRKVLTPPLLFSGSKTSSHLHCLEATTESTVKTHQRAAQLQRPAQQRPQNVHSFTFEPNTAIICSNNNPEKRSPHYLIYSAIASHVLASNYRAQQGFAHVLTSTAQPNTAEMYSSIY